MELNYIEGHGQWVTVGVITDARGDDAEAAAEEFASEMLGAHGHHESTQSQDFGFAVRFEAH